jgi:hypothetical protein
MSVDESADRGHVPAADGGDDLDRERLVVARHVVLLPGRIAWWRARTVNPDDTRATLTGSNPATVRGQPAGFFGTIDMKRLRVDE